ncbi:MAG: Ig-like domain-containing protein [Candidatus Aenigmarchaeota archaeon]|nr:Ig-like domain-containing protein [Candidatus Aenigmarchaeota archaeon]
MSELIKNKKKSLYYIIIIAVLLLLTIGFLLFPLLPSMAQESTLMETAGETAGLVATPLPIVIGNIFKIVLGFLGLAALIIVIYGGIIWMTAKGETEKIAKAKKILINGLIGLLIIVFSYAIVSFIINRLGGVAGGGGAGGSGGAGDTIPDYPDGSKYLVITDQSPKQGETVPLNSTVVISFNQTLDCQTVNLATAEQIGSVAVKNGENDLPVILQTKNNNLIIKSAGSCPAPLDTIACQGNCPLEGDPTEAICRSGIASTPDCQVQEGVTNEACCQSGAFCCGCFDAGEYTIELTGGEGGSSIKSTDGKYLKDDLVNLSFTVGSQLDTVAPIIKLNLPQSDHAPINSGIAVIFSKAINPTTLTAETFKVSKTEGGEIITGFFEKITTTSLLWRPSASCQTPNEQCHCLPPSTGISVNLIGGADGIKDTNCNSLSCNNGLCTWSFSTSDSMDLTPPEVDGSAINPSNEVLEVDRLTNPLAVFIDKDDNNNVTGGIDPTSVNYDTWQFLHLLAKYIDGSVNPNFTYFPFYSLLPNTLYRGVIYGGGVSKPSCDIDSNSLWGVKDLAGNAMVDNFYWQFNSSGQINQGEPVITKVDPPQGPPGQCITITGYNLGCCLTEACSSFEAQQHYWVQGQCLLVSEDRKGKVTVDGWPAQILSWQEINRPTEISSSNQYSPQNEIIIAVPNGALEGNNKIEVTPAQ